MNQRNFLGQNHLVTLMSLLILSTHGCGKDQSVTTGTETLSGSTIAASTLGSAVSHETTGGVAFLERENSSSFFARAVAWLNPLTQQAFAASVCGGGGGIPWSSCSSGLIHQTLAGCNAQRGGVWTGSVNLTFLNGSGNSFCPSIISPWQDIVTQSGSMLQTYGNGTVRIAKNGTSVSYDSSTAVAQSGWDSSIHLSPNPTFNSFGTITTISSETASNSTRNVSKPGVRLIATRTGKDKKGQTITKTVWDHTISTIGQFSIAVNKTAGTKTISGTDSTSTMVVQHNLEYWTSKSQITTPLILNHSGGATDCGCFPTSGVITTTYQGAKTGTETLTFNYAATQTCGSATQVDSSGATSTVTLEHCL